jgi:hypothetical protein
MSLEREIFSQHTQIEGLLEREAEIERNFSDFQELQQILPKFSDLLTQKRKLSEKIMSVKQLEQEKLLAQKLQEGAEQRRDARERQGKHHRQAYDDLCDQRDQLLTCNEVSRQARDEANAIEQQLALLEKELQRQKQLYEQEKTLTQQANEVFKQLSLCFQVCSKRLEAERRKEAAIAHHLQSTLDSIPRHWLECAQGLDAHDLEALKHKRDRLAKYEGLHIQLALIKQKHRTY